MATRITKKLIDATAPTAEEQVLWDTELRGFGVRIQPGGAKTYTVRYRTLAGKQRKQKIGRTSDMTPDKARALARHVYTAVAEGRDPMTERRDSEPKPTVAMLEQRYMREHALPFKKASSRKVDEQNWRLYILPVLGGRLVESINKADILSLFGNMASKPASANQTLALLSKAMNLAEDWGWRAANTNPCHRIKRYKLKKHDTVLSAEQMARLHQTMVLMVEEGRLAAPIAAGIRLLQLTGCRKNEILQAESGWVDREKNVLRLPDSKVGARDIPLSPQALAIIDGLDDGAHLIGARATNHIYKVWSKIKEESGLPAALRIHDLRHSAGSLAHMAGMSQAQIAELLGHNVLATTEKYIHNPAGAAALAANALGALVTASWH